MKPFTRYSCTLSRRTAQPTWEPVTQHRFLIRWASLLIESCRNTASFIETMDDSRRAPYPKPMGIPKTTQREDCGTRRKPQQPHFPHPRRICLTDSLIPADTSDRERRKARGLGYPTATRLAPADLPERRGNGATLLMLPPRGPREVARGGKPRGECLLQTSGRALAISGVTRRRAVGHPTRCLVHYDRGLLLPDREAGLPTNGTSKPHGMSACAGLR